ncbi:MAG: hypothetical protein WBA12_06690, partial [Catalinimonas sp.]
AGITISEPSAVVATLSGTTDVTGCAGEANGQIAVAVTGGTPSSEFSLNGGAFGSDSVLTNLTAGTYEVIVRDAGGCTDTLAPVTIEAPDGVTIILVSLTDVDGCSFDNGSFTVTAGGGTPGYEYALNGGAFGGDASFSNLAGGTYEVVARDAAGCTDTLNVTLNAPDQVNLRLVSTLDVTDCQGTTGGQIVVNATGGTGNYSYELENVASNLSGTFDNLPPGTYTIFASDENGCADTISGITISQPAPFVLSFLGSTDVSCAGESTGQLAVSFAGGRPAYEVSVNGGTFSGDTLLSNLPAGTYEIIGRDANGCTDTLTGLVIGTPPALLTAVADLQPATGCDLDDGRFAVTVAGGTPGYTYSLNGGAFGIDSVFTDLPAGTYEVVIRDAGGCTDTLRSIEIGGGTLLTASLVERFDASTCTGTAGSFSVSATGGTPGYEYALNGGAFGPDTAFTGLFAGTYEVVVRDAGGCLDTLAPVTIADAPAVALQLVGTDDITCNGAADGRLSLRATGGVRPYAFARLGGTFGSDSTFDNLAPGSYDVVVRDASGCADTLRGLLIQEPAPLQLSLLTLENTVCGPVDQGSIEVAVTGGTTPYAYALNGGAFGPDAIFTSLPADAYTVIVRDANGCTDTLAPLVVDAPGAFTITDTLLTNPTACGADDGTITITVSDASNLEVSGDLTALTTTGLAAGTYVATLTDTVTGCRRNVTLALTEPQITFTVLSIDAQDPANCAGDDGRIVINLDNASNAQVGGDLSALTSENLTAGTYAVTLLDLVSGCTLDTTITLNAAPATLTLATTVVPVTACGVFDGQITITPTGVGPFTFAGDLTADVTTGLDSGAYQVRITDEGTGCTLDTVLHVGGCLPGGGGNDCTLAASLLVTDVSGCQTTDGRVVVIPTGGAPGYEYSLNGGAFGVDSIFTGLPAGTYEVIVRDANGCADTLTSTLNGPTGPTAALVSTSDANTCTGTFGAVAAQATGGASPYEWSIDGGATFGTTSTFPNLTAGTYEIIVRDAKGCTDTLSATVGEGAPVLAAIDVHPPSDCGPFGGRIAVSTTGGTAPYQWSIDGGAFGPDSVFTDLAAGTYEVVVRDAGGCTDTLAGVVVPGAMPLAAFLRSSSAPNCA